MSNNGVSITDIGRIYSSVYGVSYPLPGTKEYELCEQIVLMLVQNETNNDND